MTIARALGISVLVAAGTLPASAQESLVTVELRNVSDAIATNLRTDESRLPGTVQLPIGVAAQVCGVDASTLAQRGAAANCTATTTSVALDQAVQRQLRDNTGPRADAKDTLGSGTGASSAPTRRNNDKTGVPPGNPKKEPPAPSERSR